MPPEPSGRLIWSSRIRRYGVWYATRVDSCSIAGPEVSRTGLTLSSPRWSLTIEPSLVTSARAARRSLAGCGWIEPPAAFRQGLAERAEIGAGVRLSQRCRVSQQGFGRPEGLRRRARRHRLEPLGEPIGNQFQPGDEVVLP